MQLINLEKYQELLNKKQSYHQNPITQSLYENLAVLIKKKVRELSLSTWKAFKSVFILNIFIYQFDFVKK